MKYNRTQSFWRSAASFLVGCIVLALLTFVCFRLHATAAIAGLLYLIVVVLISLQGRLVPALLISIVALCCLDYYFTPPIFEITLSEPLDLVALVAFVTTALVVTTLMSRVRKSFQEIQALRGQLRLTIDTIPDLIWSALPDGSVDFTNQRWKEYTGLSSEDARGWGWTSAVHPEDVGKRLGEWRETLRTRQPFENEFRLRRTDGEYRWMLNRAVPLRDELGNITKWYATSVDIEDRKRAEEALQKAQAELAHVTRVTTLGELAASIAHEVNQPLGAISNNVNACLRFLATGPESLQEVEGALLDIVKAVDRANSIIVRMRALAKKVSPEMTQLQLEEVVTDILSLIHHELTRRQITIHTELPKDLPPVLGDRVQLQQVLLNLVMNGVEAINEAADGERKISIRGRRHEYEGRPAVLVSVQDSGVGLKPAEVDRLFEAFYTTKAHGIGMGLAISRSIVEAHGGRLWVAPTGGPGATFEFILRAQS